MWTNSEKNKTTKIRLRRHSDLCLLPKQERHHATLGIRIGIPYSLSGVNKPRDFIETVTIVCFNLHAAKYCTILHNYGHVQLNLPFSSVGKA